MTTHIRIEQMLQDNALFKMRIKNYADFFAYLKKHKSSRQRLLEKIIADDELFFHIFTCDQQLI